MRVAIVGRGKVGRAFERALAAYTPVAVGRKLPRALDVELVLLAVPDAQIARVAAELEFGGCVLHTAGSRGVEELAALRARGASVGVLHPLLSFASAKHPPLLHGATFTLFGDRRATQAGRKLARVLGARPLVLSSPPPAYHAAAALLANGAAALAAHASAMLAQIPQRERERALAGLLASVATNIAQVGLPAALTGPVVRGDVEAVRRHLDALPPALRKSYARVLPLIVATAREAGLAPSTARALLRLAR
ncbi:MAG TPA: Rossmann-like and DUF2520 domain-containing protein [Polyangiales bacterium]|nr:Rossmann-like and DUF2520 domain-containing protein [Polyangiales bacterium]